MLLQTLKQDLLAARKTKDTATISTLNPLVSDITSIGKEKGREPTDEEAIAKIRWYLEKSLETRSALQSRNQTGDAAAVKNEFEIHLLKRYLPKQLSEDELSEVIDNMLTEQGFPRNKSSLGKIMAQLKVTHAGQYDGKTASMIAGRKLTE